MPYKNKEDKTEAVRRHRAKKEVERKIMGEVMKHQKNIGQFLTGLGFERSLDFRGMVELMQEDCILEEGWIRSRRTGERLTEPEVYWGFNMLIVVETPELYPTEEPEGL